MEDEQGFMWVGSRNGLFRYDGFRLTPYYELSVKAGTKTMAYVSGLVKDEHGRLYAGLNTGEILRVDPASFEAELFRMPTSTIGENVLDIHAIHYAHGLVWAGTESGLMCLDPATGTFKLFKPSGQAGFGATTDVVYSILADAENEQRIWVGTRTELLAFDRGEEHFASYRITFEDLRSRSGQLFSYLQQRDGKLWCAGYSSGVMVLDKASGSWSRVLPNAYHQDIMDMEWIRDELYVVHYDYGLGRLDDSKRPIEYLRDPGRKVASYEREKYRAVYRDREGHLWLGSDAGFARLNPADRRLQHIFLPGRQEESEFFFTSSVEDMGAYYLAVTSFGYGFYKWYKADGPIERIPNPIFKETDTALELFCTQKRKDGSVDIFGRKGIWRFDPVTEAIRPLNINLFVLYAEPWDGGYVVLTGRSSLQYVKDYRVARQFEFDRAQTRIERITDFTVEGDELWAVGNSCVICINLRTGQRRIWQNSDSKTYFANGFLMTVEYHDSTLVIGNNSAGFEVFQLQGEELHRKHRYDRDITGRRIRVIHTERKGDRVYLASNQGLLVYDIKREALLQIDQRDGLLVQNLGRTWAGNLEVFDDGNVIISGHGFFTIVDEQAMAPEQAELQLAQLTQNDAARPLPSGQAGIELAHDENYFELSFCVQPLYMKHRLKYRHRLLGHEGQWVHTRDGKIRYASIPPGDYTLELQASANHHWKDSALLSLPVAIVPAFYQTYWFYILCGLTAAVFGVYLYHKRISYIKQQEALKSEYSRKVAQLEMEALRAQMNPHFIFNALNSIEYYINSENTEDAVNYLQKFAALIRMTLQNSKQPYISLQEELTSLRYYIEIERMRLGQSFDFQLEIAEGLQPDHILLPPLLLQPYVENAIWHGLLYQQDKRGKLWIRCTQEEERTEIRITDNGVGRKKAATIQRQRLKSKKSMGMIITKRRMELNESITGIHTSVQVEDLVDAQGQSAGTSVIIHLIQNPISHA